LKRRDTTEGIKYDRLSKLPPTSGGLGEGWPHPERPRKKKPESANDSRGKPTGKGRETIGIKGDRRNTSSEEGTQISPLAIGCYKHRRGYPQKRPDQRREAREGGRQRCEKNPGPLSEHAGPDLGSRSPTVAGCAPGEHDKTAPERGKRYKESANELLTC